MTPCSPLLLVFIVLLALGGCASRQPPVEPPPVQLSPATWEQIDREIIDASLASTSSVNDYARRSMRVWKDRVQQFTESDFIPWFTGYWTQQWLTMKVAWYRMNSGEGKEPPEKRLALYLQEQYHQRVLDQVSKEIDPEGIRDRAMELYIQLLGQQVQQIAKRYRAPPEQLNLRLTRIQAINLGPPAARNASLYQLLYSKPLAEQPAYAALVGHMHSAVRAGTQRSDVGLSSVAQQASEKLGATLAPRGIASAVASAVGRVAGALISVAATGYGVITHNQEQPQMIEQLRVILNVALNEEWRELMENRKTGAMAGVYYLSGEIEENLLGARQLQNDSEQGSLRIVLPAQ
ncbi:hypothetical protein [Pseudomonas sp. H9]|uniref:hypothetical protein n=1 Tax=Pseudomonas sp. H9 TaxID=483968 RepID=UPI00105794A2|nr:hypothetical protein [Pseudomonas sp. H9]TDF84796.1 hypothetical protein E1573_06645 [Pseudomonas sp. H9]